MNRPLNRKIFIASALFMTAGLIGAAHAQGGGYVAPKPDASLAPAGTYVSDKNHTSVNATIIREGLSDYSFRIDKIDAKFTYDPAKPEASKVEVTMDPTSIDGNSAGWHDRLQRDDMLNTAKFTDIKFVSTSFKRTGPTTGTLTGDLTFMGVTKPMVMDVTLNGVQPTPKTTTIGFSARSAIRCSDFGLGNAVKTLHLADEVKFDVEAEFQKS